MAPAIEQLWREANAIAPNRDRSSDGTIGDPDHASRVSNHNPQESGETDWVDAIDIDHDPVNGMDIHARVRQWVAALDERLDEVISNGEIWTWKRRAEGWRPYKGSNPHRLHAHITVRDEHRHSTRPWFIGAPAFPTPGPLPIRPPQPVPTEDEDEMYLIRNNDPTHRDFGAVWAIHGFWREPVAGSEYQKWQFITGGPDKVRQLTGENFDWMMRITHDISAWGPLVLSVLYTRAQVDLLVKSAARIESGVTAVQSAVTAVGAAVGRIVAKVKA